MTRQFETDVSSSLPNMRRRLSGLWEELFTASMVDHPADSRPEFARTTTVVLTVAAISLIGLQYLKNAPPSWWDGVGVRLGDQHLGELVWWATMNLVWYVVPAALTIRWFFRRPFGEFGLGGFKASDHLWVYLAMAVVMVPVVVAVSFTSHFQAVYPFYRNALVTGIEWRFWVWWLSYFIQFLSLEFFFRGFMIHGLRPHLGFASVAVMMVPYTMIHFSKPPLETIGAMAAGLALGALSLRTRSIWLGAAVHLSVAATMDIASLFQAGVL